MVYRRRRFARGRRFRRKGYSRRRRFYRKKRRLRSKRPIYRFHRTFTTTQSVYNYLAFYARQFTLTEVPSYNEFTSLFDMYKINYVKIKFTFNKTSSEIPTTLAPPPGPTSGMPTITWWVDRDDATTPDATIMSQIQKKRTTQLSRPVVIGFRPNCLKMIYEGAASTAYGPTFTWVDCADDATPHYGIKFALDGSGYGRFPGGDGGTDYPIGVVRIDITYWCSFRDVR